MSIAPVLVTTASKTVAVPSSTGTVVSIAPVEVLTISDVPIDVGRGVVIAPVASCICLASPDNAGTVVSIAPVLVIGPTTVAVPASKGTTVSIAPVASWI